MNFNEAQLRAIEQDKGSMLIVAGPGTGKTQTLAHKIGRLLEQHPDLKAENVFAITFTTKAAKQLKDRLSGIVKNSKELPFVGTFHSLCYNLIQHAYRALGVAQSIHVISEKERRHLIGEICAELDPQIKAKKIRDYDSLVSSMKNRLIKPKDLEGENGLFLQVFEKYEQTLDEKSLLDFDDLIGKMVRLLQAHPHIKAAINDSLKWLFIDEYQDINGAQYELIRSLVSPLTQICAIGDPDQAIYGFRGSDVQYFLRFEKDFPNTTVIHLEQNYRSTPQIVEVANELINHNETRLHKSLNALSASGPRVSLCAFEDQWKEASFIAREIAKLMGGTDMTQTDQASGISDQTTEIGGNLADTGCHFADFAVLYRTKSQGKIIEEAFKKGGIPYQMVGRVPWHQESEIQLLLNCFRTLVDAGFKTGEHDIDFLCSHVSRIRGEIEALKPAEIAIKVIELLQFDKPTEATSLQLEKRLQHLENFKAMLHEFDDFVGTSGLERALQYFGLLQDQDLYDDRIQAVSFMTIHAAKGLEFPVVFVAGLEDGLLPFCKDSAEELEEERRLFYVAVTRAKNRLYLLRAKKRRQKDTVPSPFIEEIQKLLEFKEIASRKTRSIVNDEQMSLW